MTLNITMIAPWGIWQCSDYRLVEFGSDKELDPWSMKHLSVHCPDGTALITYSGLGAFHPYPGGPRYGVAEWLASILNGKTRTVDQSMQVIRAKATTLFKQARGRHALNRGHHVFNIGAFLQGQAWAVVITNYVPTPDWETQPPKPEFMVDACPIDKPCVLVTGCREAISADDWELLDKKVKIQPRHPEYLMQFLAHVNKRAASRPEYSPYISPACHVVWMPPAGAGLQGRVFDWGAKAPSRLAAVPIVVYGCDMTHFCREGVRRLDELEEVSAGSV